MTRLDWLRGALLALVFGMAGAVHAQANLEINTPAIAALQRSMQERHGQLNPLYGSGAAADLRSENRDDWNRAFVASFVRPRGLDVEGTPLFVDDLEELLASPRPAPRAKGCGRCGRWRCWNWPGRTARGGYSPTWSAARPATH